MLFLRDNREHVSVERYGIVREARLHRERIYEPKKRGARAQGRGIQEPAATDRGGARPSAAEPERPPAKLPPDSPALMRGTEWRRGRTPRYRREQCPPGRRRRRSRSPPASGRR